MKIYNSFIQLFTLLFVLFALSTNIASAKYSGYVEGDAILLSSPKSNISQIKKEADRYFELFSKTQVYQQKPIYLNLAMSKYYILTQTTPSNLEPYVQLGRIYDYTNKEELAKEYFSKAMNIAPNNPFANFYYGEFYFTRTNYIQALKYYNKAYNNGYKNRYDLNLRLAIIYEKCADLINAKKFYEVSYSMKPDNNILQKIQLINELNYDKSEYYHTIRE